MTPSPDDKHTQEAKPLLPCPFCSAKATLSFRDGIWRASCDRCGAQAVDYSKAKTERDVVTAWNRRASPPLAAAPEIEVLILKAVEAACRWHGVTDVVKVLAEIPCTAEWKASTAAFAAMEKKVEAERNAGYVDGWNAYAKRDVVAELTETIARTTIAEQPLATARAEVESLKAMLAEAGIKT